MKLPKMTKRGGGRKLGALCAGLVLGAALAAGGTARADVYGHAYLWMRGLGTDVNADGRLSGGGELRDALGGVTSFDTAVINGSGLCFSNEVVQLPYRGVERTMQTLYFAQNAAVTNENGWGWMDPASFYVRQILKPCMTDTAEEARYAFAVRFRPDLAQPHSNQVWIVNLGHRNTSTEKRGLMLGFGKVLTRTVTTGGFKYPQLYARPYLMYCGATWNPSNDKVESPNNATDPFPFVAIGEWNDVVVSVDGRTVTMLWSRANSQTQPNAAIKSATSKFMTTVNSFTAGTAYNLAPGDGGLLRIGAENSYNGRCAWDSRYTANSHVEWKHFRGSIQSFAVWTNSLTVAQMREAAAWPRTDLWRVGVANDAVTEFTGGTGDVVVDADRWNAPKTVAAGESVTFKFPLDAAGEAEMNEELRLTPTSDSAAATVRVSVNGTDVGAKAVAPGEEQRWFVPARTLLAGATNALTVARTDEGSGALKIDTVSFGGSLQYGKRDNSFNEFAREYDASGVYDLIGGNWFDGRRIIFGQGASAANLLYTNIVVNFSVPARLRKTYQWTLKWRMTNGDHTITPVLNGRTLGGFASDATEHEVVLEDGDLQDENTLNMMNTGNSDGYANVDYIRLSLDERHGFVLTLR